MMALDRLKQAASHVTGIGRAPHPFDPLSETEIEAATSIIRKQYSHVLFNAITLCEPPKAVMLNWVKDPEHLPRPNRIADVVCIGRGSKVFDGLVDLTEGKIISWETTEDVQPLVGQQEQSRREPSRSHRTDHHGGFANRRKCCEERSWGH